MKSPSLQDLNPPTKKKKERGHFGEMLDRRNAHKTNPKPPRSGLDSTKPPGLVAGSASASCAANGSRLSAPENGRPQAPSPPQQKADCLLSVGWKSLRGLD